MNLRYNERDMFILRALEERAFINMWLEPNPTKKFINLLTPIISWVGVK